VATSVLNDWGQRKTSNLKSRQQTEYQKLFFYVHFHFIRFPA
jgi:hypothetical protein